MRICDVCNFEKHENQFKTISIKNKSLKYNCIDCEYIIYYYLYIEDNKSHSTESINKLKLFLNNLIKFKDEFHIYYNKQNCGFERNNTILNKELQLIFEKNIALYIKNYCCNLDQNSIDLLSNCNIYIGQTNNPKKRHSDHKKLNTNLGILIRKYGIDKFIINNEVRENLNDLDAAEIFCIKLLKSINVKKVLNITDGGGGSRGIYPSKESLLKKTITILKRKTIENINEEFMILGWQFLSTIEEYHNPLTGGYNGIYNWRCLKCGYEKPAQWHIMQNNEPNCCAKCSGLLKKNEQDYYILAKSKNFVWVGNELPKNSNSVTDWKCIKDHIWPTTFNKINSGFACVICNKLSRIHIYSLDQIKNSIIFFYKLNNKFPHHLSGKIEELNTKWRNIEYGLKHKFYPECNDYHSLIDFRKIFNKEEFVDGVACPLDNPEACEMCSG